MTKQGHYGFGIGTGLMTGAGVLHLSGSPVLAGLAGMAALMSSALPDTLEIKWRLWKKRHALIPHRTITHWLPLWLGAVAWLGSQLEGLANVSQRSVLLAAGMGMTSGCLGHCVADAMTPRGIPMGINPFCRRSLGILSPCTRPKETAATLLMGGLGGLALLACWL